VGEALSEKATAGRIANCDGKIKAGLMQVELSGRGNELKAQVGMTVAQAYEGRHDEGGPKSVGRGDPEGSR
jgi:hypothetical protein